uniref:Uncharacterized protein n=1 Tax=Anabas testudineus TaxID=64144 RepID=A0A7N6BHF9_ANATE
MFKGQNCELLVLNIKNLFKILHVFTGSIYATVPFKLSGLARSCVVIPCSFQHQDMLFTRGIWAKKNGEIVYHNGQSNIADHFKKRTKMLGDLNDGHCSLEIDDIKSFDNGPFCFHVQKENTNYRFTNSCVFIVLKGLESLQTIRASCSVTHTCQSHSPVFSWNVQNLTSEVTETPRGQGVWETTSSITFVVAAEDGVKSLTCTAVFWRDKQQASTVNLCNSYIYRQSLWDRLSR